MRVKYKNKPDLKEIKSLLNKEKNLVVKERLTAVSLFVNGMLKRDIAINLGRGVDAVGRWITAYIKGGIQALQDHRGGDNKSFLTNSNKVELKHIITNTYPIIFKGWNGKIIIDLIKTKYNVTYSISGVYALMKSLNITCKVATKVDPKKSEEKINIWKEDIKKNSKNA